MGGRSLSTRGSGRATRSRRIARFAVLALAGTLLVPAVARAHGDRMDMEFPSGDGQVPAYRTSSPNTLVVCKGNSGSLIQSEPEPLKSVNQARLTACAYNDVQAAIDAVAAPGTNIEVLPGVYTEDPSRILPPDCVEPPAEGMDYAWEYGCQHHRGLVTIFGDDPNDDGIECVAERLCNLQIEGTGEKPEDVVIDGAWGTANAVLADRADGLYLKNFTIEHAEFSAITVYETDGWVMEDLVGRRTHGYGLNSFMTDHGLVDGCDTYGNSDSGLYLGAGQDLHGARYAVEARGCKVHHNALGYSGTSGNANYVHDNDFYSNGTGIVTDSFYGGHAGAPEDSSAFMYNRIYSNNVDYYQYERDGTCDAGHSEAIHESGGPDNLGIVCPIVPVPVGTGMVIAGGNANILSYNRVWDNWRYGFMQFWVPSTFREVDPMMPETATTYDPTTIYDTSHFNRYLHNRMGVDPAGAADRNGLDFWWDEEGAGNCWESNTTTTGRAITSDPSPLPGCRGIPLFTPGNPAKQAPLVPCAEYLDPPCDWFHTPANPGN